MKAQLTLISTLMILTLTVTNAQTKTTFGLRGGVNFYNITGKNGTGDKLDSKVKPGFNLGVNAEVPIGIDFYIQPGVLYTTKGANDAFGTENKVTVSYIEIPVNLLYKPELGSGKLILGFGPYIAFGVGGRYKYDNGNDDATVKFKNNITTADLVSGDVYFKSLDAGANFLFGYEWVNRFSVQLNAGLGLVKINPKLENENPGETSWKNTGFGLSLGYRLGK